MPSALVLADAPHAVRVDAAQGHGVESLTPEPAHHRGVQAVVLAIEAALELGAGAAFEVEPARRLAQHPRHERRPFVERLRAQPHPQEVLDDVGLDQRAVDVEDREHVAAARPALHCRPHRARLGPGRGRAGGLLALARRRLGPRHAHDRREMHVLEVMRPVVQRGVERKFLLLGRRDLFPQRGHVARVEDAVDLGVHAVELDQVQPPVEALALGVQVVRDRGDAGAQRQALDDPLRCLDQAQRHTGLRRDLLPGRKRPGRRADRLPVAVAQRVRREVGPGLVRNPPQAQRVAAARGGVIHARPGVGGRVRRHREHGVDDEVRGDDVEQ